MLGTNSPFPTLNESLAKSAMPLTALVINVQSARDLLTLLAFVQSLNKPLQLILPLEDIDQLNALCAALPPSLAALFAQAAPIKQRQRFQLDDTHLISLCEDNRKACAKHAIWVDIILTAIHPSHQPLRSMLAVACIDMLFSGKPINVCEYKKLLHQDSMVFECHATGHEVHTRPIEALTAVKAKAEVKDISIIGGGVAGASLALSLLRRGHKVRMFIKDSAAGMAASGNRQGAIYPLLSPDDDALTELFVPGFLYAKRFVQSLSSHHLPYDFCGVLHLGHDDKTRERVAKLAAVDWPPMVARKVSALEASMISGLSVLKKAGPELSSLELANSEIASSAHPNPTPSATMPSSERQDSGLVDPLPISTEALFYPQGGWVNAAALCQAAVQEAISLGLECHYNCNIACIKAKGDSWQLFDENDNILHSSEHLVLASGHGITAFEQTSSIPLAPFRGQVSHVPSKGELKQLATVLCAHGYLTPGHNGSHCMGASYVRGDTSLDYRETEQLENLDKMRESFQAPWVDDIDVSDKDARVAVRMVSRDHLPMAGPAPDVAAIMARHQEWGRGPKAAKQWQTAPAPVHRGLYVFAGLGSRGLSSAPLIAEALADTLSGTVSPFNSELTEALNPNRMWLRKLKKGKALD